MHSVYRLYALLALLHPAVALFLLTLGFDPQVTVFHFNSWPASSCAAADNNSSGGNASSSLPPPPQPQQLQLASGYFLGCLAASGFSMVYLSVMDSNQQHNSDEVRIADLLFWSRLLCITLMCVCCLTQRPVPTERLLLRIALHFGGLYLICSPRREKHNLSVYVAFLLVLTSYVVAITVAACSQTALVLSYLHCFLDMLLVLGHRWDQGEEAVPPETLFNARMAYVAFGGALMHADAILAG
jgi:hypothetical protein